MKKFLRIAGFVILYHLIIIGACNLVVMGWLTFIPKDFAYRNFVIADCLGFLLTLLIYGLIFKFRKKSLIKTMNFRRLSFKNFLIVLTVGILMGVFTCLVCNTPPVLKNMPVFENYLKNLMDYATSFPLFLLVVGICFAFEEMIFRGAIMGEIRTGAALYPTIFISVALYGLMNCFMMGWLIGIYAVVASLFYTLGYVWQRSLWASITFQVASIYVIATFRKTGIFKWLSTLNGAVLFSAIIVVAVIIAIFYYNMYKNFQKPGVAENATVSA
ncbi:MAG TPA: type II CAAX endopeptidase family protein [Bacillota bacterium]|nr:type II CAAX endopeptidase family protein [Bacillota bacterium]